MEPEIITEIQKTVTEFKAYCDRQVDEVKKSGVTAPETKAALDKLNVRIDELHAKMERPNLGNQTGNKSEHAVAFEGYMRKGHETGLGELEKKSMSIGSSADGGYAVPKEIDASIASLLVNISPIREIATVRQISTSDYHKLVNVRGTASGWVGEAAVRTATATPQFSDIVPPMGELYAFPQATQQMLDDVFFNAEQWLSGEVATEFARAEGAAFVVGTGTTQPKGFTSYTAAATADGTRAFGQIQYVPTGVAGDWAATNKGDVLITLIYALKAAQRQGARFVTNKALLGEIRSFKDAQGRYLWQPALTEGQPQTLLGYPITEAEDMPVKVANALALAFGNFKNGYLVVDRVGTRVLRDPFTNKPYIGFYTTKRVGGAVVDSEAIKVIKFSVS